MKRATTKLLLAGTVLASGLSFDASARPGGGSSYSGSSRSYSGGSSSYSSSSWSSSSGGGGGCNDGDGIFMMFAVPLMVIGWIGSAITRSGSEAPWEAGETHMAPRAAPAIDLRSIERRDPNFSRVLLEDFLFELYARALSARGDQAAVDALQPWFTSGARESLATRGSRDPVKVDGVVVGSMDIVRYREADRITVEYKANYTETVLRGGSEHRVGFYARERWTFIRRADATSPPPSQTLAFNCPSCGAPVACDEHEACTYCGETNEDGRYAWRCIRISLVKEETRGPTLTGYAPEVHGPSIPSPAGTQRKFDAIVAKHHGGDAKVFNDRVEEVYHGLNDAWSSLEWDRARPLLTDRLWLSWRYWVHAYEEQDLRNEMRKAELERVEIAKIDADPYFDVVVLRIYASALDFTKHVPSDTVVGGDANWPREYSEYWTFIRPTGRDGSEADDECPNCGASLEVEMAGRCNACRVKVQRGGDFDWVLSKVEQDEAYRA